jgi:recombination protein RecA
MKSKLVEQIRKGRKTRKNGRVEFLSTGCTVLDLTLGGGIPVGKMINIVGDKSTGKSLLTTEFIVKNFTGLKNFNFKYDDAETGYNFNPEYIYGVKFSDESFCYSRTIEEFEWNFEKFLEQIKGSKDYSAYIIDSFDAIGSEDDAEKYKEKMKFIDKRMRGKDGKKPTGTYAMGKQKEIGNFFRLKCGDIQGQKIVFIIISQVRENIGVSFGAKYKRSGGKALDFYASQCFWLAECMKIEKSGIPIGVRIKVKVKKNKVGNPFRECFVDILFDYGVDEIGTNLNYLFGLLTKTGQDRKSGVCEWDGKEYKKEEMIEYIEENNLEGELKKKVVDKWKENEDKIKTKRKGKYIN